MHPHNETIRIKQYVVNEKGGKTAAILDIKELGRIEKLLEDLSDLRAIESRTNEKDQPYDAYRTKRKLRLA